MKKILRLADEVGEKISHIKCARKRWHNDSRWFDKSKPPVAAPIWAIASSYHSDEEEEEMEELERDEYYENATASSSRAADVTEDFDERTEGDTGTGGDNEVVD